jgi:uncharacterized phiE125 gp8 family phage protein
MYQIDIVTPPASHPITLAEAKAHLKIQTNDDDYVDSLIATAHRLIAKERGVALIVTSFRLVCSDLPRTLGRYPLASVESIQYRDSSGALATLDESKYEVYAGTPGRVAYGDFYCFWPCDREDRFVVQFTAGYESAALVPDTYKHAMKLMIGHLYEQRQATYEGQITELPLGVKNLLDAEYPWSMGA